MSALSILLFVVSVLAGLPPQGQVPQPAIQTGRIEGAVMHAGGNDPIAGAQLVLTRINTATGAATANVTAGVPTGNTGTNPTPTPQITRVGGPGLPVPTLPPPAPNPLPTLLGTSDGSGRFSFSELEAGNYRLTVSANGYVRQEYGQRIFPGRGALLNVTAGETVRDLTIRLAQTGNISGHIIDNTGRFAVNVPVQLLKPAYNSAGQRSYQITGMARTDDRGQYRIYWVTPGKYVVAAGSPPGPVYSGSVNPNDATDYYSFSFFPGVSDVARAATLDIQQGGETSADFTIPRQQLYHVRGTVVDATGRPPSSISVSMAYQSLDGSAGAFNFGQNYDARTGRFDVSDIAPGAYVVQVSSSAVARASIEVVNSNVDNLSFVLGSGAVLTGRVHGEGIAPLPSGWDRARVQLRGTNVPLTLSHNNMDSDGAFKVEGITPADYRVVVTGLPADLYVKDLRLGGLDMLSQTMRVTSGTPIDGTLDVVLSAGVSQLEGAVLDDRGQPIAGVQVVLVPDRNRDRSELFRAATSDQSGHFAMRGLPPGDFKLFAWESGEAFGYFDTTLLRQSEGQARPVHISESSRQSIDVRVIH